MRTGSSEFLTSSPCVSAVRSLRGIDYDDDDDAPAKLDAFLRHVQRIFTAYGGNLVHLSVGDKGAYLYGVFGSPYAHEDDAARASAAALELRELPKITAITTLQIGITYGRLRSGLYGHEHRQAFTCLGDAVNLAARTIGSVDKFNAGGTRMRHTANSKKGSSGSPCLNANLQLVALHHAHDPAYPPQWNQAVPFGLIRSCGRPTGSRWGEAVPLTGSQISKLATTLDEQIGTFRGCRCSPPTWASASATSRPAARCTSRR